MLGIFSHLNPNWERELHLGFVDDLRQIKNPFLTNTVKGGVSRDWVEQSRFGSHSSSVMGMESHVVGSISA